MGFSVGQANCYGSSPCLLNRYRALFEHRVNHFSERKQEWLCANVAGTSACGWMRPAVFRKAGNPAKISAWFMRDEEVIQAKFKSPMYEKFETNLM